MQLTRRLTAIAGAVAVGAWLSLGCGGAAIDTGGGMKVQPCIGSTCVAANVNRLAIELFNTNYGAQEMASVPLDPKTNTFQLTPQSLVHLSGTISLPVGLPSLSLANASIVATRPSRILGRPDVSYQGKIEPSSGAYSVDVVPNLDGEQYTLRLSIDATVLPPYAHPLTITGDLPFDIPIDAPTAASLIAGVVQDALGLPLVGVNVQAHDASGNTVSSIGRTDAQGHYTLALQSGATTSLTLAAVIDPTLTVQRPLVMPQVGDIVDAGTQPTQTLGAYDLELPPLPNAVQQVYRLSGTSAAGIDTAVSGAHASATAQIASKTVSDMIAIHLVAADSDSDGNLTMNLYPQEGATRMYSLVVSPEAQSDYRATTTDINAGATAGFSMTITLDRRSLVSGLVLGPTGSPLKNAQITPTNSFLAATYLAQTSAAVPRVETVNTDADGRFSLRADPGIYDLSIAPDVTDELPRFWLDQISVYGDLPVGTINIPIAVKVTGALTASDQNPISGLTVRVFSVPSMNSECAPSDYSCLHPAQLQSEVTSQKNGTVVVLLPTASN